MSDIYTCADCGGMYPKGWTDEEAQAERDTDFPGLDDEDAVVVCDDCYRAMRKRTAVVGFPWAWTGRDAIDDAIARAFGEPDRPTPP